MTDFFEDKDYEASRKSVIWVSLVVCLEAFLGFHISELPHLENVKDWKVCIAFILIISYLTYRLFQFCVKDKYFSKTENIFKDSKESDFARALNDCENYISEKHKMKAGVKKITIVNTGRLADESETSDMHTCIFKAIIILSSNVGSPRLYLNETITSEITSPNGEKQIEFDVELKVNKSIHLGKLKTTATNVNFLYPEFLHVRFPFIIAGIALIALTVKLIIAIDIFPYQVSGPTLQHPVWAQPK